MKTCIKVVALFAATVTMASASEIVVNSDTNIVESDASTMLTVNSGTATLLNRAQRGYRHYRFKVERPYGASATYVAFSEIRLFNGETDVTASRSGYGIAYSSEWDDNGTHFYWGKKFGDNASSEYLHGFSRVLDGDLTTDVAAQDGKVSASDEIRDKVWIRIDFANPQLVTSYDWARSDYWYSTTDARLPDPADWRFQGSDDGTTWTDLDVRSNFLIPQPANYRAAWAGPFDCSYSNEVCTVGTISMADGAETAISGDDLAVGRMSGGSLALMDGASLVLNDGATVSETTIANGTIVKTGAGTASVEGNTSFAGSLSVLGGSLRFIGTGGNRDEFYRFTFTQTSGKEKLKFGRILFYDENGTRTGQGAYSEVIDAAAADLAAGQIAYSSSYAFEGGNTPRHLFKGDLSWPAFGLDKIDGVNANLTGNNGMTFQFAMRVLDGTAPIKGYLFQGAPWGGDKWFAPVKWTVESSPDGVTWRTVDEVVAGSPASNSDWTPWNGGTPWTLSNRNAPAGTAFLPSATVSVANGARLDLAGSTTTQIGNLEIDVAAGAGTISDFNPAASGSLYLVNLGSWTAASPLPIALENVSESGNLGGWDVFVDGVKSSKKVVFRGGELQLASEATVISIR